MQITKQIKWFSPIVMLGLWFWLVVKTMPDLSEIKSLYDCGNIIFPFVSITSTAVIMVIEYLVVLIASQPWKNDNTPKRCGRALTVLIPLFLVNFAYPGFHCSNGNALSHGAWILLSIIIVVTESIIYFLMTFAFFILNKFQINR